MAVNQGFFNQGTGPSDLEYVLVNVIPSLNGVAENLGKLHAVKPSDTSKNACELVSQGIKSISQLLAPDNTANASEAAEMESRPSSPSF